MTGRAERAARAVVRYGVPAAILVSYLAALRFFDITADSVFGAAVALPGYWTDPGAGEGVAAAGPLWMLLLGFAGLAGFETVLAAKAYSMACASMALLMQFLVAHEIVRDRLAAFALCLAAGGLMWFAPAAAAGTPHMLALLLVLAGIFFQLRNDYLRAALFLGLAGLAATEAWPALLLLVADVLVNTVDRRRGWHVAAGAAVVWVSVLLPWVAFALWRGVSPVVPLPAWTPGISTAGSVLWFTAGLALLALAGIADLARIPGRGRTAALTQLPGLLLALMFVAGSGFSPAAVLPGVCLLLCYAALGVRVLLERRGRSVMSPAAIALLAGLSLLVHQIQVERGVVPAAKRYAAESEDLRAIAEWLRSADAAGRPVEAERRCFLRHASGRMVGRPGTAGPGGLVVSREGDLPGYTLVFRPPPGEQGGGGLRSSSIAVWSRGEAAAPQP